MKKLFCVMVLAALLLSLVGCSEGAGDRQRIWLPMKIGGITMIMPF